LGDYQIGWQLFEWRWKGLLKKAFRNFPKPLWLGNFDIKGKKILISQEQGLGDFIQYSRYIPLLKNLGADVIVECNAPVMVLASNLGCEITIIEKKKALPDFDIYCPLMSLPLAFRTDLNNIPSNFPYIKIPDEKQKSIKNKLGPKKKLRVGLIWAGSKNKEIDLGFWRERSLNFKNLISFLDLSIEFHVLQKEIDQEDQGELKKHPSVIIHKLDDFLDTAAIMNEIDIIISVDTAGAHLAGALAKELWILIPSVCDYRWLMERKDSPWYPTAKLYRQEKPGDWSSVINNIKEDLRIRVI
jgi:ADP-heptose:LPS heptosyltransferase